MLESTTRGPTPKATDSHHRPPDIDEDLTPRSYIYQDLPTPEVKQPPSKWARTCGWIKSWSVPYKLGSWRWGLQEALTVSLLFWVMTDPQLDQLIFKGNSRWVVLAAVPVIEGTAGGTIRRLTDRVLGTILAAILVLLAFLCTIGVRSTHTHDPTRMACLYVLVSLFGFIYNALTLYLPAHPLLGIYAAYTSPVLVQGSIFTGSAIHNGTWRAVTVTAGVFVSGLVTRYFVPRRARLDAVSGLSIIVKDLAAALEPLIELESGMVMSPSFFNDDPSNDPSINRHVAPPGEMSHKIFVDADAWLNFKNGVSHTVGMSQDLVQEDQVAVRLNDHVEQWSRFGMLNIQRSVRSEGDLGASEARARRELTSRPADSQGDAAKTRQHQSQPSHHTQTGDDVKRLALYLRSQQLYVPTPEIPKLKSTPDVGFYTSDMGSFAIPRSARSGVSAAEEYKAEVEPAKRWAQVYGPTIGAISRHIHDALIATGEGLLNSEFPIQAEISLMKAAKSIAYFHRQRSERQQALALFVEHVLAGTSKCLSKNFLTKFQRSLGVSIADYEQLSPEGKSWFWKSFWTMRDRLSITDVTITTLFVSARTAIESIEELTDARIRRLEQGEPLHDLIDIDHLEVEQSAAVKNAGGLVRPIFNKRQQAPV